MGNITKSDNIVLLFENYSQDSKNLHTSFKMAGKEYPAIVIEEDGFLPDDVTSVYSYFLGEYPKSERVPGKPRYFNQITVPDYWEISANNSSGKVHDLNKERARIFYAEPKHKRLVKVVDWYDDRGTVRSSDHYNKYGALYARTIFNAKGQRVNRTYFNAQGKEVIMENFVTKDIILNDGDKVRIFDNKLKFILFFMEKAGYAQSRLFYNTLSTPFFVSQSLAANDMGDVLFWQEPKRTDIPGNMQVIFDGKSTRTGKIMVQKKAAYEKLIELGAATEMTHQLGFIYPFKKENTHKPNVLICTNSDNIEQCQKVVESLPELHFYIAALTEMSSKLMSMEKYSNVTLYPGAKMHVIDRLFEKCDIYMDINHEGEIVSAVQTAFLHNHLIFAFKETMHNVNYVAEEHIYTIDQVDTMIGDVRDILLSPDLLQSHIELQHAAAMLEDAHAYTSI